jgi:hypothetical protein
MPVIKTWGFVRRGLSIASAKAYKTKLEAQEGHE